MCLFDVRLPANDVMKMETCPSIGGLHAKVYILIFVHTLVYLLNSPWLKLCF